MRNSILLLIISAILVSLLSLSLDSHALLAADPALTTYIVPSIRDEKILPDSSIPSSLISNLITITASPGEYEPASFVVRSSTNIDNLTVVVSDLTGPGELIPAGNVDIRVVKCWYQAGTGNNVWGDVTGKFLTPELLLKNDSLVKIENGENYVWNGAVSDYTWISERSPVLEYNVPFSELSIQDSEVFQPVDIPANTNKQFWLTIKIPDDQVKGNYTGTVQLVAGGNTLSTLQVQLEILPFTLDQPYYLPSLFYMGRLDSYAGISSYPKTQTQLDAEMSDMYSHGITLPYISFRDGDTSFREMLTLRQQLGIVNQPLFTSTPFDWTNLYQGIPLTQAELDAVKSEVTRVIQIARQYGVSDVYFYAVDEAREPALSAQRTALQAVHEAGGLVLQTGPGGENITFPAVGDLVDIFCVSGVPTTEISDRWHSVGAEVVSYANPQAGVEKPETYRNNFGLLLWQKNYDGIYNFAYQWSDMTNVWNDFDTRGETRDHNFSYPTDNGVIDTIQWEGFREGIDDIRYLTTLLNTIEAVTGQKDTSAAESWLNNLRNTNLTDSDLNTIRSEMTGHIISLQNQPPVLNSIDSKSINEGELLTFTVSASDAENDNLTFSASNLPTGASFNPFSRNFSWMPGFDQAGIYNNVHFEVSDGSLPDSENITITVNDVPPTLEPDVNADGQINVLDLIMVGQHWSETGLSGWIPEDINQDGTVNVLDSILIGQYWTG